jgi:lysophospholipase L1-like esterase
MVVLGDSFAGGVGNPPYVDAPCKRSDSAYGAVLARYRFVTMQAFAACSGARTTDVLRQVDSITADTDVVTVQVLGNDFFIGTLEGMCFAPGAVNCNPDTVVPFRSDHPLFGKTVGDVVASISELGPAKLDIVFQAIKGKLVKPGARVIVLDYPNIVGSGGMNCPGLTTEELTVARRIVTELNSVIKDSALVHGFRYVSTEPWFRGLDACGFLNGIYPPIPPGITPAASADLQGALHPNRLGHLVLAAAVLGQLRS